MRLLRSLNMSATIANIKIMTILLFLTSFLLARLQSVSPIVKNVFGTKTAYEWVNTNNYTVEQKEFHRIFVNEQVCHPVHIAVVLRHGARFPGQKDILKISKFHDSIKSKILHEHFASLKDWVNPFSADHEKLLSVLGEREHYELGQRFAERWKSLLQPALNALSFISSSKQRTKLSALNFYNGLMETLDDVEKDDFEYDTNDDLLRFHEACQKFVHSVDRNKTSLFEVSKFKKGNLMRNIAKLVSVRLGISQDLVDPGIIKVMFIYCAVEMGLSGKSEWCRVFENSDLEVLEYAHDLKQYWKKAYGYSICHEQSCPLIRDIFMTMDEIIDPELSSTGPAGRFFFGHAETLFPLYAALGLFNDSTRLRADNYEHHRNRLFKSSQIMPFSGNLAFVLYKCDGDSPNEITVDGVEYDGSYIMKFFLNEKEIEIPGCDDFVCPYKYLRKRQSQNIDSCDFLQRCKILKNSKTENKPKDEL